MQQQWSNQDTYKNYDLNILVNELWDGFHKNIWTFLLFKPTNEAYQRDIPVYR